MIETDIEKLRIESHSTLKSKDELDKLFAVLDTYLNESSITGVGLSGVQIGIYLRVAIIRTKKLYLNLYNTQVLSGSGNKVGREGCLSLPNQFMQVPRATNIVIRNGDGKLHELSNFEARVCQHEMDHWNGILILDRRV